MDEKSFTEGLALGHGMKGGWADDWFALFIVAILLGGIGRTETEVTRKEFDKLREDVESLKGGADHAE